MRADGSHERNWRDPFRGIAHRKASVKRKLRLRILLALYCGIFVAALVLALLDLFGLLPAILVIAACGGLAHLSYTYFFDKLPDYLDELQAGSRRPKRES